MVGTRTVKDPLRRAQASQDEPLGVIDRRHPKCHERLQNYRDAASNNGTQIESAGWRQFCSHSLDVAPLGASEINLPKQ